MIAHLSRKISTDRSLGLVLRERQVPHPVECCPKIRDQIVWLFQADVQADDPARRDRLGTCE